jgi:hypothetical protein
MKRALAALFLFLLVSSIAVPAEIDDTLYRRMTAAITSYYGQSAADSKMYVGSENCLACHPGQTAWRESMHATGFKVTDTSAYSMQWKRGVIADYDQNGVDDFIDGLDFNTINSVFDKYKPNAPVLGYSDQTGYTVKVGEVTHSSKFAYGGSGTWKQRFMLRIMTSEGESMGHYASPVQYNDVSGAYAAYHPENWWAEDGSPLITPNSTRADAAANGKSFDSGCSGCHFTGLAIWQDGNGEWRAEGPPSTLYFPNDPHYYDFNGDRIKEHINTGCERCHGPGSQHILSRGDPEQIINPKTDLTAKQSNELCGACHTRGKSLPDKSFGFPHDEATNTSAAAAIGEGLERFYAPSPGQWPDKKAPTKHRQQYLEYLDSNHSSANIACYTCHDVHNKEEHHEVTEIDYRGTVVPTKNANNTQCLACHAGKGDFAELTTQDIVNYDANLDKIAKTVSGHTYHPYAPERQTGLSRCSDCHLPNVAKSAIPYDVSSHTFEAIPPEKTLMYQDQGGMPSSCAVKCHRGLTDPFGLPQDSSITTWNEASDAALAEWLKGYYGPDGKWWKTEGGTE